MPDLEVAAKPAYRAKTAWTPMYKPGTLNVSNMISAVYSLFSGVFSGGSVKMKLCASGSILSDLHPTQRC